MNTDTPCFKSATRSNNRSAVLSLASLGTQLDLLVIYIRPQVGSTGMGEKPTLAFTRVLRSVMPARTTLICTTINYSAPQPLEENRTFA